MVDRKPISDAQRFGVWKAWGGRCAWCRQPVLFKDCHIDHIIPVAAAATVQADALTQYGKGKEEIEPRAQAGPGAGRRRAGLRGPLHGEEDEEVGRRSEEGGQKGRQQPQTS